MLFKRDLKIEQAMYRLYQQIEVEGLYFYCLHSEKEKARFVKLKPGSTIEEVYKKFGRDECLVLIYANSDVGMKDILKMERCMYWLLGIVGFIWVALYGLSYYYGGSGGGSGEAWNGDESI